MIKGYSTLAATITMLNWYFTLRSDRDKFGLERRDRLGDRGPVSLMNVRRSNSAPLVRKPKIEKKLVTKL